MSLQVSSAHFRKVPYCVPYLAKFRTWTFLFRMNVSKTSSIDRTRAGSASGVTTVAKRISVAVTPGGPSAPSPWR